MVFDFIAKLGGVLFTVYFLARVIIASKQAIEEYYAKKFGKEDELPKEYSNKTKTGFKTREQELKEELDDLLAKKSQAKQR